MEGTDRVFEHLVRDHQDRIYALGLALTGNRHDAEEVAQDTFLRAYRAVVAYPPERIRDLKQRAWLHQIALNVFRNRVRGVRPRLVELNGSEPDHASGPLRVSGSLPFNSTSRGRTPRTRLRTTLTAIRCSHAFCFSSRTRSGEYVHSAR